MESRLELVISSRQAERDLDRLNGRLNNIDRAGGRAQGATNRLSGEIGGLRTVALAASGALAAMGVTAFGRDVFNTVASVEKMRASLATVTGSIEGANQAWDQMREFAKTTPFELDQAVQGFIRMKSLGLDPTEESMRAFANTAAAMNTDLMQMVEAVADATVGEFERLREYGIRASQDGDRVSLTFQGVTTEIGNNAREIQRYLENIGNVTFADAAIDQMDTLGGKANNLSDSITDLYVAIGEAGATDLFNAALDGSADTVDFLTNNVETLAAGVDLLGDAAIIAAGIYTGRFVAAMAAGTASLVSKTAASVADARAEAAAAQQTARRTGAELQAANAIRARAVADAKATAGTNAHAIAMQNLVAASGRATAAQAAHTAAMNTSAAAMGRASLAARGLSGALALAGGPLGLLVGAGGLMYMFREELGLVRNAAEPTTQRIDNLTDALNRNSVAAVEAGIVNMASEYFVLGQRAASATAEIERLTAAQENDRQGAQARLQNNMRLREMGEELAQITTEQEAAGEAANELREVLKGIGETTPPATNSLTDLGLSADELAKAAKDAEKEADRFASTLQSLQDRLFPVEAAHRSYRGEQLLLQTALMNGTIGIGRYMEAWQRLEDAQRSAQTASAAYGGGGFGSEIGSRGGVGAPTDPLARGDEKDYWGDWLTSAESAFSDFGQLNADMATNFTRSFGQMFSDVLFEQSRFRDGFQSIMQGVASSTAAAIGEMIAQWIAYQAVTAAVGAFGGGGGGLSSLLPFSDGGLVESYASGGYTGSGEKYDPAGIVHAGEFVVRKDVVERPGVLSFLDGLNRGYAAGGYVSPAPAINDRMANYQAQPAAQQTSPALGVEVHFHEDKNRAGRVEERSGPNGQQIIDVTVANIMGDGKLHKTLEAKYGLSTKATN